MAIYLASFDIKAMSHDYSPLYDHLQNIDAHQAQASAWMIETSAPILELMRELRGFMDKADSVLLVEMASATRWAATHLSEQTGEWFKERRP